MGSHLKPFSTAQINLEQYSALQGRVPLIETYELDMSTLKGNGG